MRRLPVSGSGNAPVHINGGDGFDVVIVIGTEFGDDFVITPKGVYGAGLNVNFVNIEQLEVDGAEGDDRFFVLGTGPSYATIITGGLGTDLISIQGPTPANGVISNDLLGHSGIVTNSVESVVTGPVPAQFYDGIKAVGVSANVADNDEPGVVVTQSDGYSLAVERANPTDAYQTSDATMDTYTIGLTRPPLYGEAVVIQATPPSGIVFLGGTSSTSAPARG